MILTTLKLLFPGYSQQNGGVFKDRRLDAEQNKCDKGNWALGEYEPQWS